MIKKKVIVFFLMLIWLNASTQNLRLEQVMSLDLKELFKEKVCESCVKPIPQRKSLQNGLFFYVSDDQYIFNYDPKSKKIKQLINTDFGVDLRVVSPFFTNKRGDIHFLILRNNDDNAVVKVESGRKKGHHIWSSLKNAWIIDRYNTTRDLSSFVSQNGKCFFNIVRTYNDITIPDYFEKYKETPVSCSFDISKKMAKITPIHFYRSLADKPQKRLANNFWFFDVVEPQGCMYFQNMCADTIYDYHIKSNTTKKIVPSGSQYNILPIWFNPDSTDMSDVFLEQNLVTSLYIDYPKNRIYRRLGVNVEEGKRYILQILNLHGAVLVEQMLEPKYVNFIRIGSEVYIYARENKKIKLYQMIYENK